MTFADAAVEVLRLVGRPMHFKKITQVAIAKNLLSHVGKTPEVTMSARLAAAVTKDRGSGPIVRTKAGIFGLRDWGDSPPNGKEVGENDALPIDGVDDSGRGGKAKAKGKAEEPRGRDDGKKKKDAKESKDAKGARGRRGRKAEAAEEVEEEAPVEPEGRATTPESTPPAAVVAAADEGEADEGDEDEGGEGLDEGPGEGEAAGPGAPGVGAGAGAPGAGQGRRRRRRRRRRGGERVESHVSSGAGPIVEIVGRRNGGTGETAYALSAGRAGDITAPAPEPGDNGGAQAGSGAYPVLEEAAPDAADADLIDEIMSDRDEERELIPGLGARPERPERAGRDRHERDRGDRGPDRGDRGPDRGERRDERRPMAPAPAARPDDTLADGAYRLLFGQERTGGVPVRQLADQAIKAHMLPADSASPWMVIGAALRADIQRRVLAGTRPRFRALSGGRWGLFEWGVGGEAMRLEAEAASVADRQREAARRTLLRRIVDMGDPQFEHLVLLLVDRLGYDRPRRVTRPNAHRELHLAASSRVGPGGVTVALVFARGGREIDAARITELRGALHHYGAAMGWVVTTGSITPGARDEAGAAGAPPIGLTDGAGFARLFEETGVGLVKSKVELSYLDVELLDALKSGA